MALKNEYDAGPQPKINGAEYCGIGTAVPVPKGSGLTSGSIAGNDGLAPEQQFPEKCEKLEWNGDAEFLPIDKVKKGL